MHSLSYQVTACSLKLDRSAATTWPLMHTCQKWVHLLHHAVMAYAAAEVFL